MQIIRPHIGRKGDSNHTLLWAKDHTARILYALGKLTMAGKNDTNHFYLLLSVAANITSYVSGFT